VGIKIKKVKNLPITPEKNASCIEVLS